MRIRIVTATFASVTLIAFIVASAGYIRTKPRRNIEALYCQMDDAMKRKDLRMYVSHFAADYEEIRLTGKPMSRDIATENYRKIMADWITIDQQSVDIDKIVTHNNLTLVTVNHTVSGTLRDSRGAFGAKMQTHRISSESVCIDTWESNANGWQLRVHNMAMTNPTVDGKPFGVRDIHDND